MSYKQNREALKASLKDNQNIKSYRILTETASYCRIALSCSRKVYQETIETVLNTLNIRYDTRSYMDSFEKLESSKEGQFYRYELVCRMWNNGIDGEE